MARTSWKHRERQAAALIGGTRYPANQGGLVDCESDRFCCQVKERKVLPLKLLEGLALEMQRVGAQKAKLGVVMVKRSAGRGVETPWLVVMTGDTFTALCGADVPRPPTTTP